MFLTFEFTTSTLEVAKLAAGGNLFNVRSEHGTSLFNVRSEQWETPTPDVGMA